MKIDVKGGNGDNRSGRFAVDQNDPARYVDNVAVIDPDNNIADYLSVQYKGNNVMFFTIDRMQR